MLRQRNSLIIVATLCAVSVFAFAGCNSSKSEAPNETEKSDTGQTEAERCRKKLAGAIRRLGPEVFSLESRPERSLNGLNSWLAACGAEDLSQLKLPKETLARIGSGSRAMAGRFTVNDAAYIRDCLLLRDLTNNITKRLASSQQGEIVTEAAQARAILQWVTRNISLIPGSEQRVPLGLFDVMLTGRGTTADRLWVCASALRQQQIDAVLVRANAGPATEGGPLDVAEWLIGVIIDDQCVLYDAATGLAVTQEPVKDIRNGTPASASILQQHDRWKTSTVEIVAQTAAFAPRMLVLQQQLAVEDSAVLFEEFAGGVSEIRPVIERVSAASGGLWSDESISVWNYPEETSVAAQSLSEAAQNERTRLMRPFDAPFEREPLVTQSTEELTTVPEELSAEQRQALIQERLMENFTRMMESDENRFGKPSQRLLKTRIRQLLGISDTSVIQQLQQVRIASLEEKVTVQVPLEVQQQFGMPAEREFEFPQMVVDINRSCTGSALYWTAISQMERGDVGAAISTFMNYRRQYADEKWTYPSMINQAMAMIDIGQKDAAIAVLKAAQAKNRATADDGKSVLENPEHQLVDELLAAISGE